MHFNSDQFGHFTFTFGAVKLLLQHAVKKEAWIESVLLSASFCDALLRITIILTVQLERMNESVQTIYYTQLEEDSFLSEREIIRRARKLDIISDEFASKLNGLYDLRNRAVHRLFLDDITYKDLRSLVSEYAEVHSELIGNLESAEELYIAESSGKLGPSKSFLDATDDADRESVIMELVRQKIGDTPQEFIARVMDVTSSPP